MSQVPIDTSVFASDLIAMVADLPATAYFGGTSFPVSSAQLTEDQQLLLVGNNDGDAVEIIFPISYLATAGTPGIQARMAIKMAGQAATANYQVKRRELMEDGVAMRILLVTDNRVP